MTPLSLTLAMSDTSPWWVYLILTESEQLYTGIATDPERRFREHLATFEGSGSKGAKFFRGQRPIKLIYRETAETRSAATRREIAIKKLSKDKKWRLIEQNRQLTATD